MSNAATKTEMLADRLREWIATRNFPANKLPREVDLCREFGVARITVRNALEKLRYENLVERKRHSGTFVRPPATVATRQICVLTRTTGHLYSDIYHAVIQKFMEHNLRAYAFNAAEDVSAHVPYDRQATARMIAQILEAGNCEFIIDGYCCYSIPHLDRILKQNPIFFNFIDSPDPELSPKCGVWYDYRRAGYLAGRHLLKAGCRNPLMIGPFLPPEIRFNPEWYQRHREKQYMDGFREALQKAGMDGDCHILGNNYIAGQEREEIIAKSLSRKKNAGRVDGLAFTLDSLALNPIKTIMSLGLVIPRDICIVGMNNTPWSREESIQPFSSIEFSPLALADALCRLVETPPAKRGNIYIEPKLIERK